MQRKESFKNFQQQKKYKIPFVVCNEQQSSYVIGQTISCSENSRLEFKNYQWPFTSSKNKDLELILLKTICSFINRDGGTILIGVTDQKKVEGVQIENVDDVKKYFDTLKERFYPRPQGLIKTVEIPIRKFIDEEQYFWIPNAYVIRIEVKQGKLDRFYTFKIASQMFSAFREDASAILIKDIDEIQEQIYIKSQHPADPSKQIVYEEPDQEGLQESYDAKKSKVHENKGNYIAFTNLYKNYFKNFIKFLDQRLKERKIYNVEFFEISDYALFISHSKMMKLYNQIEDIVNEYQEEIKQVTISYQDLQFGFPKKSLTIKVYTDEEQEIVVETVQQINCQCKIKEFNGYNEILILNIQSFEDLVTIYQYFKDLQLKTYISLTKPEKKQ
ncbi:hypothetical protein ABPG74_022076 [Tetrahymena malaccensis]